MNRISIAINVMPVSNNVWASNPNILGSNDYPSFQKLPLRRDYGSNGLANNRIMATAKP